MKKKLLGTGGMTLVEILISLIIVMLATMLISAGSNLALTAYRQSRFVSESGVLTNTLDTALGDILRYAAYTGTDDEGNVLFKSTKSIYYSINGGYLTLPKDGDGNLTDGVLLAVTSMEEGEDGDYIYVVGKSCYTSMYIDDAGFSVTYDDAAHVFSIDFTIRSSYSDDYKRDVHFDFASLSDSIAFGVADEESEST